MPKKNFFNTLKKEIARIDDSNTQKRDEIVIEGFEDNKAIIKGKKYLIFNSNDYLGLRFNKKVNEAEEAATNKYGSGPGAVRFISGTMKVHEELELALAKFHDREAGMLFSSAFAANLSVIHCIIKGQSKDSLVENNTLVISDELNHRSIIDGIRVAGLPKDNKKIYKHLDLEELENILRENKGNFKRVLVVTDGIFSMLGIHQDVAALQESVDKYQDYYDEGIITCVDDSHGVAAYGKTGRGTEEASGGKCDLLVGTLGKGFGTDGGYVVGDKVLIDYLKESAATYIYSNPVAPGTAGAALEAVKLMNSEEGELLLEKLNDNITYFKEKMLAAGFVFAAESSHAIQPILIANTAKTRQLKDRLFEEGIIVTNINYPVVPKGKDEIRVQLSATHSRDDIDEFIEKASVIARNLDIITGFV